MMCLRVQKDSCKCGAAREVVYRFEASKKGNEFGHEIIAFHCTKCGESKLIEELEREQNENK